MTRDNGHQPFPPGDPDGAPTAHTGLPVVVIGAGPVGLAAAAHLLDRGLEPLVLEAGPQVGANVAQWRHVRLFSPWCLVLDPVSVRLLERAERGSYVGCIAGALSRTEYEQGLATAGFTEVSVTFTHQVGDGLHSAIIKATRPGDFATAPTTARRELPVVQESGCC